MAELLEQLRVAGMVTSSTTATSAPIRPPPGLNATDAAEWKSAETRRAALKDDGGIDADDDALRSMFSLALGDEQGSVVQGSAAPVDASALEAQLLAQAQVSAAPEPAVPLPAPAFEGRAQRSQQIPSPPRGPGVAQMPPPGGFPLPPRLGTGQLPGPGQLPPQGPGRGWMQPPNQFPLPMVGGMPHGYARMGPPGVLPPSTHQPAAGPVGAMPPGYLPQFRGIPVMVRGVPYMLPRPPPSARPPPMVPRALPRGAPKARGPPGMVRLQGTERMTGRELAYIVRMQLSAVKTGNSFSDDYYFLQHAEKRRKEQMEAIDHEVWSLDVEDDALESRPSALLRDMKSLHSSGVSALGLSRNLGGPLPTAPGVKTSVEIHVKERADDLKQKTESWHNKTKVFGRSARTDLRRPRELISVLDAPNSNGDGPFKSRQWNIRACISDVANAVLEIHDLHRLLKEKLTHGGSGDVGESAEVLQQKQRSQCTKLGKLLGLSLEDDPDGKGTKLTLDSVHLLGLLWLQKGRRMMCRAVPCLIEEHHVVMLEACVQYLPYLVCTSPQGSKSDDADEQEKAALDELCVNMLSVELRTQKLAQTTRCASLLLGFNTPDSLRALMGTPGGSAVIRGLLVHGQQLAEADESSAGALAWSEQFAAFLEMGEKAVKAGES